MRTIEAVINEEGQIQLLETVERGRRRRAIVIVLDDPGADSEETAVFAEKALRDWNRPDEDSAWSHLQSVE
jgi:hypothetical protein